MSFDREVAIAVLVFRYGGVAGAIRRIVYDWPGRFSSVQIRMAMARRCPLLVPNRYQVEDCLDRLEKQRFIECVLCRHSKLYRRRKFN